MAILNVVNPGLVNVADEGYPAPLPGRQGLARNLGILTPGSQFAPPVVPPQIGELPPWTKAVSPEDQNEVVPNLFGPIVGRLVSLTTDISAEEEFVNPVDLKEYVVTEAGSFTTNAAAEQTVFDTTITAIIDADTGGAPGVNTIRYRITLADSLVKFGITFIGREVVVVGSAVPANLGQSRVIDFWSVNVIFILKSDGFTNFGTDLVVGNTLEFNVDRDGFEVVSKQLGAVQNIFLAAEGPLGLQQQVQFTRGKFLGNFRASTGVAVPFVGSGTAAPPFQGTTEVETQTFGRGLPANVFV